MKHIFILIILWVSYTVHAEEKLCVYPDSDTRELEQFKDCGSIKNGLLIAAPELLSKIMWSKYGMQCIYMDYPNDKGWFFINQNGFARGSPFSQDNDCKWFKSGLAVGVSNGHIIYFNQAMAVVKSTRYTWASNFYRGYSKVCIGELAKEYDISGEHYQLRGGQCGFIDREFQIVVPVRYSYESTPTPPKS